MRVGLPAVAKRGSRQAWSPSWVAYSIASRVRRREPANVLDDMTTSAYHCHVKVVGIKELKARLSQGQGFRVHSLGEHGRNCAGSGARGGGRGTRVRRGARHSSATVSRRSSRAARREVRDRRV